MRIALLGYAHPFGLGHAYGAERIIYYLMNELIKQKHEVTVFSVKGCTLPGCKFVEMSAPWNDNADIYLSAVEQEESNTRPFDFIHSYMASGSIAIDRWLKKPYYMEPFFAAPALINSRAPTRVIALSKLMNSINGNKGKVIYYGIPDEVVPTKKDNYLAWCGRIDSGKAPCIAIEAAKRANKRIILMGPSYHYPYFVESIWPHIDNDKVIWLRGVDDEIKNRVLNKACGFLFPNWNKYHEMFGIVAIEALRASCPVIGWAHKTQKSAINYAGGEIIAHGVHGFINEYTDYTPEERERSIEQAVQHINQLGDINPATCRSLFKERFTAEIMTNNHLAAFKELRM